MCHKNNAVTSEGSYKMIRDQVKSEETCKVIEDQVKSGGSCKIIWFGTGY